MFAKLSAPGGRCNPGSPGQHGRLLVSRGKNSANLFRNVREIHRGVRRSGIDLGSDRLILRRLYE